jgi:hypothetical protein
MAGAVAQSAKVSFNGTNSGSKAFSSNVTAGNPIVVFQTTYVPLSGSGDIINTPTDTQSNTYVPLFAEAKFSSGANINRNHVRVFITKAASTGSCTVSFGHNQSGSGSYNTCFIYELSGCDSFALTGVMADWTDSAGTSFTVGNLFTDTNAFLLSMFTEDGGAAGNPATMTPSAGWSAVISETNTAANQAAASASKTAGSRTDYSITWTSDNTGGRYGILLAFLPLESDAGGYTPPSLSDSGVTTGTQSAIGFPDIGPAALYDASAGKTIVPFLGSSSNLCVVNYNGSSWDSPQISIAAGGVDDGHGSPAIVKGPDNKFHIFWGCHNTALKYVRSTNANDATAWTAQSDIAPTGAGAFTYPFAMVGSDSSIVVYGRFGGHTADWGAVYSTNNGSSWSKLTNATLDSTSANVWYVGRRAVGDDVHWFVVWEDEADSSGAQAAGYPLFVCRFGLYYFKQNWLTGDVTCADGTSISYSSLPLTKTNLDAHCVVKAVDTSNPSYLKYYFTQESEVEFDDSGHPACMITFGSYDNHKLLFIRYNGSTWDESVICCTGVDHTNDGGILWNRGSGRWSAFVVRKGDTSLTNNIGVPGDYDTATNPVCIGGGLDEYQSTDDGVTWTRKGNIYTGTRLNFARRVYNGTSPIKLLIADYPDIGTYNGKIYGFKPSSDTSTGLWLIRA